MTKQQTVNFYGGIVKRVLVVFQKDCATTYNHSTYEFIKKRFNSVRNYREFVGEYPVEILQATSERLPRINSLKEGDACLIIGCGRFIDKASYEFATKCFSRSIPVFFIRSNSLDCDPRVNDSPIWKTHIISIKAGNVKKHYQPPKQYFMQIPTQNDLILMKTTDSLYALLPGMVPV